MEITRITSTTTKSWAGRTGPAGPAVSLGPPPVASVRMLSKLTDELLLAIRSSIKFAGAGHGDFNRISGIQRICNHPYIIPISSLYHPYIIPISSLHTWTMYATFWNNSCFDGESRKGMKRLESAPSFQSKPYKADLGPDLHKASGVQAKKTLSCADLYGTWLSTRPYGKFSLPNV